MPFQVGERVLCGGYPGTIVKIEETIPQSRRYSIQFDAGMIQVRPGGHLTRLTQTLLPDPQRLGAEIAANAERARVAHAKRPDTIRGAAREAVDELTAFLEWGIPPYDVHRAVSVMRRVRDDLKAVLDWEDPGPQD